MKIGIILHPYDETHPAGLGRAIFEWTSAIIAFNTKDEYIIFLKQASRKTPQFPNTNWRVEVLGKGMFWLDTLSHASKADVYIFNTPIIPFFWHPSKSIIIAHDFAYRYLPTHDFKQQIVNKILSGYHGFSMRRASHVIAVSEATKNDMVTLYKIRPEKISVVYQGFISICKLPEKQIKLPEKFFLFVGVLKYRKNVKNIIRAFIQFYKRNCDYNLVIIGGGDGDYAHEVKRIAHESKAAQSIHFLGFISDNELSYVYKRATVFLFPSWIEGFGFPVLEAMDCGIPVITSNTFSLPEVGGKAALIVNPHDIDEISCAMEKLVGNSKLREKCIFLGKEHAANFSWEKSAREISNIIESLYNAR